MRRGLLLLESLVLLALASAAVQLLPFRRAVRFGLAGSVSPQRLLAEPRVADIRWAVEAMARRVPWRAVCIEQGIAMQRMLRRRGCDATLHYGVGHGEEGRLAAHVWVSVGEQIVIGGAQAPLFRQVATFP
jgi:hypothetical protein